MIEKRNMYTRYHELANSQSIDSFAEVLKNDYKAHMDKKLLKCAHWVSVAEHIKAYLDECMEDIDV
jgi:hypothetical protein